MASPSKLAVAAAGGLVPSLPTGSVMDRLARLERRADALAEMGNKAEVCAPRAASVRRRRERGVVHFRNGGRAGAMLRQTLGWWTGGHVYCGRVCCQACA